jgi:hypothetical protein
MKSDIPRQADAMLDGFGENFVQGEHFKRANFIQNVEKEMPWSNYMHFNPCDFSFAFTIAISTLRHRIFQVTWRPS